MENIYKNSNSSLNIRNTVDFSSFQQDTIPKQKIKDTTDATLQGINPLFLIIERKTQEVEAYREQAKTRVERKPVPTPRDTVCYICPKSEPIPLHQLLNISSSNKPPFFPDEFIYDRYYYNEIIGTKGLVFIETQHHINQPSPSVLLNKTIPETTDIGNWVFYPIFASIVLLAFLKLFFTKQLIEVFRSTLFFHIGRKLTRDGALVIDHLYRLLDGLFIISMPVTAMLLMEKFSPKSSMTFHLIALYVLMGIVLFRIFKFITIKLIGFISNETEALDELNLNQLLYSRFFSVVLVPVNLLALYTSSSIQIVFLYIAAVLLGLMLFFRFVRTLQVFIYKGFSMFYFILYLCALEIIPWLIVFKEIIRE
jgi:hypothetical protein